MKKARRYIGLFLASVLTLSNIPTISVRADSSVTNLKVSVVGEGEVILDDFESKYTLESGDVFKANCTVDTSLKITVNSKEGNTINDILVNGKSTNVEAKGNTSYSYDYTVPSDGADIKITFAKKEVETPKLPEEVSTTPSVAETPKADTESAPTEEVKKDEVVVDSDKEITEDKKVEGVSEEAKKVIAEYESGVYTSEEAKAFRKGLVESHKLEEYVDSEFFFDEKYLHDLEDKYLGDLLTLIRLSPRISDEALLGSIDLDLNSNLNSAYNAFFSVGDNSRTSVTVTRPNHNNISAPENSVSYYEGGYFMGRTGVYYVNGRPAFCADHHKTDPASGTTLFNVSTISNDLLRKILYYGSGGPGQISGWDGNALRIGTALAISNVRHGTNKTLGNRLINAVSGLASPPSSFIAQIGDPASSSYQSIAFWSYNPKGSLQISKESSNPDISNNNSCYSLAGAEYGVYLNSNLTGHVATLTIGANNWSQEIQLDSGTYFLKEIKAPKGFALDNNVYPINVTAGSKATKTMYDRPAADPIAILLRKVDADTGNPIPQGNGSLENAHFTFKFYAGEFADGVNPEDLGYTPTRTWVMRTNKNGYVGLGDAYRVSGDPFYYLNGNPDPILPLGTLTVQETKAPVGYKINSEVFVRKISANSGGLIPTFNEIIIKEKSLNFVIKKVQSGTSIAIPGATFRHTKPDGTSEELQTGADGLITLRAISQGVHTIVETSAPEGYEVNKNEFKFEVLADNTIKVLTDTTSIGMNFVTDNGDGVLTVEDDLKPYTLKIVKVNDKNALLPGAEFTLYSDKECNNEITKLITNDKGILEFGDLKIGTKYYFKETKAPEGYRIPVDKNGKVHVYEVYAESSPANGVFNYYLDGIKYSIDSTNGDICLEGTKDNRVISVKVVNTITMKLPKTGSRKTIPILIFGSLMMMASIVMCRKSNKLE